MALPVGAIAPDVLLKTKTDDGLVDIDLARHRGKETVVLLFVPAAFTGVCTEELCSIGLGDFPGAVVYGISVDSPFAQEAWAKQAHIRIPLLSDYQHRVTQAFDVVLPDLAGLGPAAQRAAFVIDKEGVIRYSEATPTPKDLPDFAAIAATVAGLSSA